MGRTDKQISNIVSINNYKFPLYHTQRMHIPQSSAKGTVIYTATKLISKPRLDLIMYKANES